MPTPIKLKQGTNYYQPLCYFPIGYVYLSVNNANPGTYFGGTWEPIKDRFLLLAGDTYKAGSTGGEATHKLTVEEMPSHKHNISSNWGRDIGTYAWGSIINQYTTGYVFSPDSPDNYMSSTGGDKAHNNMPPYLVIYGWKKVSN